MEHLFKNGVNGRRFTGFVAPSVIMFVILALYTLIDAIFVSNFVSSNALAAVNIVYPLTGLGWGISVMLASGSSAIVAIKMGEGEIREAREKFSLICIVSVLLGVTVMILCLVFLKKLILLLGATEILQPYCLEYARIIVIALPAAFIGVILEYYIRVDGKPGFTLFLYISGGVVHILLDFLFIVVFDWGLSGAGWATAAGQITVMVAGLAYFTTQNTRLRFIKPQWDRRFLWSSLFNGSSEMVSEVSVAITIYIFNLIVLGLAGEDGVAALSIVFSVHYLLISVHLGFITGTAPLISFYYGAREYEKVNLFLKYSKIFIGISSLTVAVLALTEAPLLAGVFVEKDTTVCHLAVRGIKILSGAFLFTGINVFASGFFTAYANGGVSALISLSRGLIMVLIGAAILPQFFGLDGVWLTTAFAEITTLILTVFMLRKYRDTYRYRLI